MTLPSPNSGLGNLPNLDQNIISSFDQIEEARFEVADFKKNLLSLIDFFDEHIKRVQEQDLVNQLCFQENQYRSKIKRVKNSFKQIEGILEGFALGLTKQLNETHTQNLQIERDRDELSQSLHQIELCYQKNKQKLERDLNKMEYKVKVQGQDAREKMQLRHIKGLDIVENEVNRMMPPANKLG